MVKSQKTNLVQRNSKNLEKKNKRKYKNGNTKTDKNFKRNTTNEENNLAIKREISRSGDNTYYKNNGKKITEKLH